MNRFLSRLGALPIGGVAIALLAVLTVWDRNMHRVGYEHALPTILFVVAAAAGVTLAGFVWLRSWARAGLLASLIAGFIFYSVPVAEKAGGPPALFATLLLLLLLVATILIAGKIPAGEGARTTNGKLNLLLLLVLVPTTASAAHRQWRLESGRPVAGEQFERFSGAADERSPDVWHLLFDRYASREILESRYRFDNRPFLEALRSRGFAVGESRYSNYQRTAHSVASTLNGSSLDRLAGAMRGEQNDWLPIYRSIAENQASAFFARAGYRTIFAGTWWSPTRELPASDVINHRSVPELGRRLLDQTALGPMMRWMGLPFGDGLREQCERTNHNFAELEKLAREPGRKHVFAHFLVPHPPFVLNPDGSCRTLQQARAASRRDNYVAQVEYANRRILRLVDAILAQPRPAVIIVHSDEGPWPDEFVGDEHSLGRDAVKLRWTKLNAAQLQEKMGILLAVRGPVGPPVTMPESPVQIYPAVLNDHFGRNSALPRSTHEVYESEKQLYRFRDVAARLR